jgi:hypothetical protein
LFHEKLISFVLYVLKNLFVRHFFIFFYTGEQKVDFPEKLGMCT